MLLKQFYSFKLGILHSNRVDLIYNHKQTSMITITRLIK